MSKGPPRFRLTGFRCDIPGCGSTAVSETGLDEAKEGKSARSCRLSLPLSARARRWVHGHLPEAASGGYLWQTLEEAQANAREEIELCLEVLREDGQPIPPPDRDLASPIDQLVAVADAEA